MKYFIRNTFIFLFVSFFITGSLIFISNKIIDSGDYFKIKKDTKYIVLGHSHPECAYNDSIIHNLENFAQSAESYYYTYFKLKKILQSNNQINTVFLEFSNYEIDDDWDYLYTWSNECISSRYPKYSAVIGISDLFVILEKNIKTVINSQSTSLKYNAKFLFSKKTNFPASYYWGGYQYLIRDKTDSLLTVLSTDNLLNFQKTDKLSTTNFNYLLKIIEFCKNTKVNLYLIRSPLHPKYHGLHNEPVYQNIINTKLSNVEFLDFKNFPLQNSEFGDLNHLNYKGAKKFSLFFNRLLEKNLLQNDSKQGFINNEIEMIKKRITYN